MKIKNIEDFTLEECQEYLNMLPNGEDRVAVKARINAILKHNKHHEEQREKQKKTEQEHLEKDIKWIDIKQFLSEKRYRKLSGVKMVLVLVLILASFLIISTLYYINTPHEIYSHSAYEQVEYTSGLERLLLEMDFIKPDWYDREKDYPQYTNYEEDNCCGIPIPIILITILLLGIVSIFDSSSLQNIYNIEQEEKVKSYRRTQNRRGKYGLHVCNKYKMKQVLLFEYDNIYYCGSNAYICVKGKKRGVYNTVKKKMVLELKYDSIDVLPNGTLCAERNGMLSKLTTDGYRIIE